MQSSEYFSEQWHCWRQWRLTPVLTVLFCRAMFGYGLIVIKHQNEAQLIKAGWHGTVEVIAVPIQPSRVRIREQTISIQKFLFLLNSLIDIFVDGPNFLTFFPKPVSFLVLVSFRTFISIHLSLEI